MPESIQQEAQAILNILASTPFIEEMFRDCKNGGYNIEGTSLKGERLIKIILLMTIADSASIFQGTKIKNMQVQKYVSPRKEPSKKYRIRST